MDAAIPMDAKSAPTGIWKTAPSAVFHSAHTHHLFVYEEERRRSDSSIVNLSTESGQVQATAEARKNTDRSTGATGETRTQHGPLDGGPRGNTEETRAARRVDLTRFGGHLPKGGYDVQTDGRQSEAAPSAAAVRYGV